MTRYNGMLGGSPAVCGTPGLLGDMRRHKKRRRRPYSATVHYDQEGNGPTSAAARHKCRAGHRRRSAYKVNPCIGVIGVPKCPLIFLFKSFLDGLRERFGDVDCGDDCEDQAGGFYAGKVDQADMSELARNIRQLEELPARMCPTQRAGHGSRITVNAVKIVISAIGASLQHAFPRRTWRGGMAHASPSFSRVFAIPNKAVGTRCTLQVARKRRLSVYPDAFGIEQDICDVTLWLGPRNYPSRALRQQLNLAEKNFPKSFPSKKERTQRFSTTCANH